MANMALLIPPRIVKQLSGMPKADAERLLKRLKEIAAMPDGQHPSVVAMAGEAGVFRVRQGDWRAVYAVEGGDIILERVMHRREVYR